MILTKQTRNWMNFLPPILKKSHVNWCKNQSDVVRKNRRFCRSRVYRARHRKTAETMPFKNLWASASQRDIEYASRDSCPGWLRLYAAVNYSGIPQATLALSNFRLWWHAQFDRYRQLALYFSNWSDTDVIALYSDSYLKSKSVHVRCTLVL